MNLEFIEINISKFKSFDQATLNFDDFGPGLHFLRGRNEVEPRLGSNGAGKSTLWDALTWCLYGKTIGGLRNPDIKPRLLKSKKTAVTVSIMIDGKPHRITRTANPNKLTLDKYAVGQEQVDHLLGMSLEVFAHSIIYGQGRPLFFDLQPRDKMALFSEAFNLERWERRSRAAADEAKNLILRCAELDGKIQAYERQVTVVKAQLKTGAAANDKWEAEHTTKAVRDAYDLSEVKKLLGKATMLKNRSEATLEQAEATVSLLERKREGIANQLAVSNRKYAREEAEIEGMVEQADKLDDEISEMKDWTHCPVCERPLKGTGVERHREEVASKVKALRAQIKARTKAFKAKQARDGAAAEHDRVVQGLNKANELARTTRKELADTNQLLLDLNTRQAALEATITEAKNATNPFTSQLAEGRRLLRKSERMLKQFTKLKATAARRIERVKFWQTGFKEVRLFVIDEVLAELDIATTSALEDLGLVGWSITYAIERETKSGATSPGLTVNILAPGMREPVRWEAWSGGEGQRLRLAGALALSDVLLNHAGIACSFEVFDEPTQHLSEEGVRDLCDLLADRAAAMGKATWLVDHMAIEGARFASAVTIVKDAQGSRLEA